MGLVPKKLYQNTVYQDPISTANHYANLLKQKERCDLVICLSHLGFKYKGEKISDMTFAGQTRDIDLIIGGHTHTFLKKPVKQLNVPTDYNLTKNLVFLNFNLNLLQDFGCLECQNFV